MATKDQLKSWFDAGIRQGATHMIVVCDTFDYNDYPVYVKKHETVRDVMAEFDKKDMQTVMEVYSMKLDKNTQLEERRAFHCE